MTIELTQKMTVEISDNAPAYDLYKEYLESNCLTKEDYPFKQFINDEADGIGISDDWIYYGDIIQDIYSCEIIE